MASLHTIHAPYRLFLRVVSSIRWRTRRLLPQALWHLIQPGARATIKHTGIANEQDRASFYPSIYHFINNIPSSRRLRHHDFLVCQNFLTQEFLDFAGPKLFFSSEPMSHLKEETMRNLRLPSVQKFLYRYGEPDIEQRQFYFALPENRRPIVARLERQKSEHRPKLCCIVNRYSETPGLNLLERRIEFVEAFGRDIDIYGREPWKYENRWEQFPNYYGATEDKLKTFSQYRFALAFENTDLPGYITEKIVHAILAGTVPLYWGGGRLLVDAVPADCFINCRDADPLKVLDRIKNMTHAEVVTFREAGIKFLSSNLADRFTRRYWAKAVASRLEAQLFDS